MRIDRILADLLAWITQIAWYRAKKIERRPYERLNTLRLEGRGMIHRVARPPDLCPRDCGAYIFEPFRTSSSRRYDIHIVCDHLDGMAPPPGSKRSNRPTHRITILQAEHWIGDDGRYDADELFSIDDDLQGRSQRRDLHIACILYQMALMVDPDILIDWLLELDNAKKYCMKSQYTPTLILPKHAGEIITLPADGIGDGQRVRLD